MHIHTISSREFNQDVSAAKKAANEGPVYITDRGRLAHVLLSIEDFQRLTGVSSNIVEVLSMPESNDIDFEPPRVQGISRPADFS